jgi:hypothetical protein
MGKGKGRYRKSLRPQRHVDGVLLLKLLFAIRPGRSPGIVADILTPSRGRARMAS